MYFCQRKYISYKEIADFPNISSFTHESIASCPAFSPFNACRNNVVIQPLMLNIHTNVHVYNYFARILIGPSLFKRGTSYNNWLIQVMLIYKQTTCLPNKSPFPATVSNRLSLLISIFSRLLMGIMRFFVLLRCIKPLLKRKLSPLP